MGPSITCRGLVILSVVFVVTASGQDVSEADESKTRMVQEAQAAGEKERVGKPAEAAAPSAQPAPGQILIKPTGRKRVSSVGVAPPPPEVDYRVLARGDQPKGGGPYVYYPVGYCPTYSYYGVCYSPSSYDCAPNYSRPYCP
jgi:hypothetical protein